MDGSPVLKMPDSPALNGLSVQNANSLQNLSCNVCSPLCTRISRIWLTLQMATLHFPKLETKRAPSKIEDRIASPSAATASIAPSTLYHRMFRARRVLERQPFDQEYVDRLSRGEPETATHFIGYFTKLLVMKLRARLRSSDEAEDVAQESLYRVLVYVKKHGGIDHPERLGAFVNSVSENVLLEFFRDGRKFQQVPENTPEPVEQALDAELTCITRQRKELVRRVLGSLKKKDRIVLEKVYLLEQDKDAICAELKIDRNYLRVQVYRALGQLRKAFQEESEAKASAS